MAPPTAIVDPPAGWEQHAFWHNLRLELAAHRSGVALASVFFALLVIGRALVPALDRPRLRVAFVMFMFFFVSLPLRAELLSLWLETAYFAVKLGGLVFMAFGVIDVGGLLVFDLIGRRLKSPRIFRDVTIIILSGVALVMLLSRSGVNLLSLITTSAVLTAVIGLSLQDTLTHLVSGIALQLESSIGIGDWIRVDDKPIGKVLEIRWRSTLIQTKNGDLVVVPNAMITRGVITNFNKDGLQNRRWVHVNVHLRHPPNLVQQAVLEALQGTPNMSVEAPPDCLVWAFRDSWLEYAVRYRLIDYLADDGTDSEVRKRIWYALRRHGIEIAYPGHNVFVTELNEARQQLRSERERQRRLEALRRVDFFAPLSDGAREQLASQLRSALFGAGERIISAGAAGDSLYLIDDGEVAVKIAVNGFEKELATLGPGDFFGEMSLMTGDPRRADVVAKSDVQCYVVERAPFQEILQKNAALVGEIGKLFAEREAMLKGQREGLTAEAARARVDHQALLGRIMSFFGLT
jgi:small-conductance mechanosensitive channel/CRP-like cAMP-binding protein